MNKMGEATKPKMAMSGKKEGEQINTSCHGKDKKVIDVTKYVFMLQCVRSFDQFFETGSSTLA